MLWSKQREMSLDHLCNSFYMYKFVSEHAHHVQFVKGEKWETVRSLRVLAEFQKRVKNPSLKTLSSSGHFDIYITVHINYC